MKKLIAILGLVILTITACAQNEWKYPIYIGKNGFTGGVIVMYGATSGFTRLEVPAIAGNITFRFPSTLGTPGQFLTTDGAGTMSWTTGGAGSMVYPALGIPLSDGTQWIGSIVNNSANWNTAYGWGNHATVGYVTGTPWTSMGYVTGTPWTSMGYLTSETSHADVLVDGDFTNTGIMLRGASPGVYTILTNNSTNWNTAYGWGNHASVGYLTTQTSHADVVVDGDFTSQGIVLRGASSGTYSILTDNSANWNTAFGWGNHASGGYYVGTSSTIRGLLSSTATGLTYTNSTGVFSFTAGYSIPATTAQTNWNTAYGWGDHGVEGYQDAIEVDNIINDYLADAEEVIAQKDSTGNEAGNYVTRQALRDSIAASEGGVFLNELRMSGVDVKSIPIGASNLMASNKTLIDGTAYWQMFYIPVPMTLTGVKWLHRTQGVYTPDEFNGFALYSVSGTTYTKVAESSNTGTFWSAGGYALGTAAFTSSYSAAAGLYMVSFVYNSSAQTTAPSIYSWNAAVSISQVMTGGHKITGFVAAQATLPATEVAGDISGGDVTHGIWLY